MFSALVLFFILALLAFLIEKFSIKRNRILFSLPIKNHVVCVPITDGDEKLQRLVEVYSRKQVRTTTQRFEESMVSACQLFDTVFPSLRSQQKRIEAVDKLMAWYWKMYHFHCSNHQSGGTAIVNPLPLGEFSLD